MKVNKDWYFKIPNWYKFNDRIKEGMILFITDYFKTLKGVVTK